MPEIPLKIPCMPSMICDGQSSFGKCVRWMIGDHSSLLMPVYLGSSSQDEDSTLIAATAIRRSAKRMFLGVPQLYTRVRSWEKDV